MATTTVVSIIARARIAGLTITAHALLQIDNIDTPDLRFCGSNVNFS
jgi:hypothetical protein